MRNWSAVTLKGLILYFMKKERKNVRIKKRIEKNKSLNNSENREVTGDNNLLRIPDKLKSILRHPRNFADNPH